MSKTLKTVEVQRVLQNNLYKADYFRSPNRKQGESGGKFYANGYEAAVREIADKLGIMVTE
jgi:hypothetical protein